MGFWGFNWNLRPLRKSRGKSNKYGFNKNTYQSQPLKFLMHIISTEQNPNIAIPVWSKSRVLEVLVEMYELIKDIRTQFTDFVHISYTFCSDFVQISYIFSTHFVHIFERQNFHNHKSTNIWAKNDKDKLLFKQLAITKINS